MIPLGVLFKRFLKIGAMAYGGPAIAQEIKRAIVKESRWISEQDFLQSMAFWLSSKKSTCPISY